MDKKYITRTNLCYKFGVTPNIKETLKIKRLFVYGTLAPGRPNHSVLENIPGFWEKATLKGILLDEGWGAKLGCPGVIPQDEGEDVKGFVFSSNHLSKYWPMLDEYEGINYKRVSVMVKRKNGKKIAAYVYALNKTT
jgi:gamma-glutamylcyclotransferase (GGCT)/AIG2-like uncharacterized protein YtfP